MAREDGRTQSYLFVKSVRVERYGKVANYLRIAKCHYRARVARAVARVVAEGWRY